jgi:hypothetical protein
MQWNPREYKGKSIFGYSKALGGRPPWEAKAENDKNMWRQNITHEWTYDSVRHGYKSMVQCE